MSDSTSSSSLPVSGSAPLPPRIPDHELLKRIGRGAYGEVWIARSVTGAYRAVKIVRRSSFDHERPFEREFEGILKFEPISRTHDSQVDILHVGRGEDYFYYVMELADDQVSGGQINPDNYHPRTLKSELLFHSRLSFEECVSIGIALTTALEHLHQSGLVHRDVKPSNIIFVNGVAKLADIGLVTGLDTTRSYVGTEGFAAPEGPGTPRGDLFSLGKVLYEMSTGKDRQEFPELPTNLRELPDREGLAELNAVIAKACRHDPRDRYASAAAMRADLELLQSGKSLARLHRVERRLRFVTQAGAAVTALAVLVAAGWFFQRAQTQVARQLAAQNLKLAAEKSALADENRASLYAADINLAQQALAADNLRQALDLLQKHVPKPGEPDLRGFEWRYLWAQCQSDESFSLPGHSRAIASVAFSPDGRMLATASYDNTVNLADIASRRTIAVLRGHTNEVYSVSFSPRGDLLASATGTEVWLWDTTTFKRTRVLPEAGVKARFSPDGKHLVSYAADGLMLMLWNTQDWSRAKTFRVPHLWALWDPRFGALSDFAFLSDRQEIAVLALETIKILRLPDLAEVTAWEDKEPRTPSRLSISRLRYMAASANGQTLVAGKDTKEVKVWDLDGREPVKIISDHTDRVYAAAFAPDGTQLATASADQTIKLWDLASGELRRTFRGHGAEVWDVAFSPDGKLLASVGKDGAIKLWDPQAKPNLNSREGIGVVLGYDTAGDVIASVEAATFHALNPETLETRRGQPFPSLSGQISYDYGSLLSDGHLLSLLRTRGRHVDIWDLNPEQLVCSVAGNSPYTAYAPHKKLLATVTSNLTISVWQLPQGVRRCVIAGAGSPVALALDGTMVAAWVPEDKAVRIWEIKGNEPASVATLLLDSSRPPRQLAFSPDGTILATGEWEGLVKLWSVPSGAPKAVLTSHKREVASLSFSPDGRTLATSSSDGSRLWHVATQRELLKFPKAAYGFSPDGRTLAGGSRGSGQELVTWYAPSFPEIAVAEGRDYRLGWNSQYPAVRLATAAALAKRQRADEALEEFTQVIRFCETHPEFQALRHSALRQRAELLKRSGQLADAGADNCARLNIPARDPGLPPSCVDLSPFFNQPLESSVFSHEGFLGGLPRGQQLLGEGTGIQFDIRGVLELDHVVLLSGSQSEPPDGDRRISVFKPVDPPGVPHAVEGIRVGQKCRRLHFLHGARALEKDGTVIGTYLLRYADETRQEIPLVYGQELRVWVVKRDSKDVAPASLAWTGTNANSGPVRLFRRTWENPHPEKEIRSLDFVSRMTRSAPFLIAITAE